jgi:hypothetical protein
VATSVARVDGLDHVFLANFTGLVGGKNPVQTVETDIKISLPASSGGSGYFLPFLGEVERLTGSPQNGRITFILPPVGKGGVFWYRP